MVLWATLHRGTRGAHSAPRDRGPGRLGGGNGAAWRPCARHRDRQRMSRRDPRARHCGVGSGGVGPLAPSPRHGRAERAAARRPCGVSSARRPVSARRRGAVGPHSEQSALCARQRACDDAPQRARPRACYSSVRARPRPAALLPRHRTLCLPRPQARRHAALRDQHRLCPRRGTAV